MSRSAPAFDAGIARRWLDQLADWDPKLHAAARTRLQQFNESVGGTESAGVGNVSALETIVRRSRPVLAIKRDRISLESSTIEDDAESRLVVDRLQQAAPRIEPLIPLVGRIDAVNEPAGRPFVGTGWLIDADIVVTNRHVADLIARWNGASFVFRVGRFNQPVSANLDFKHEIDNDERAVVEVAEVIWIERDERGPDIAFLKLKRARNGLRPNRIELADTDAAPGTSVAVIGYPARASDYIIPDQRRMDEVYRSTYDVKRIAPGLAMPPGQGASAHDCTTLGGNSGSVVLDTASGKAVGLHFAGVYLLENYAVPASTIRRYLRERPWQGAGEKARLPDGAASATTSPAARSDQTAPVQAAAQSLPQAGAVTMTIPIVVTVGLGQPADHIARPAAPGSEATAPTRPRQERPPTAPEHMASPPGSNGATDDRRIGVLFATNRTVSNDTRELFGAERNPDGNTYGVIGLRVPEAHRFGRIELPSVWKIFSITLHEEQEDAQKHFTVGPAIVLDKDAWRSRIASIGASEALVFVHGFNVSFRSAALSAAQIVWDLQYNGVPVMFSWPSRGQLLHYEYDRNSALASRNAFLEVIQMLRACSTIRKVHVLAHSMGNFVVGDALATARAVQNGPLIDELMMAAPDLDRDHFLNIAQDVRRSVGGMTIYASSADRALMLSKEIAGGVPRAGDVPPEGPVVVPQIDTIDATVIGREILGLGHSAYASKRSIVNDLALVMRGIKPPGDRLVEIREVRPNGRGLPYWRFQS